MRSIRLGAGAGFSGDRIQPAVDLARDGELDFLIFECLAERTIARAQQEKLSDPTKGYDSLLVPRIRAVMDICRERNVRIITNMGAAAPIAAAQEICALARQGGQQGLKVAVVTGDDVTLHFHNNRIELDNGCFSNAIRDRIVSANAYLGGFPIARALDAGADIVVCGRTADPALFLGAMIHSFGWQEKDYDLLGKGTLVGHLLECAGQLTGGYFADPGFKDVPQLANIGFPIGEVSEDGSAIFSKLPGTGGLITPATVKEQLLYEIHDPSSYMQPDVDADFSKVTVESIGSNQVRVTGGTGRPKSGMLKISVGCRDSFIGEGQISYGGSGAVRRGELALDIVRHRLSVSGIRFLETRYDLIGLNALHGPRLSSGYEPYEVRARVVGRVQNMEQALAIGNEVEALYTNGPAGGGGVWKHAREVISVASAWLPESDLSPDNSYYVA